MDPALKTLLAVLAGALLLGLFDEWRRRRPPADQLSLHKQQINQLQNEIADLRNRLRQATMRYSDEARAHALTRTQAHEREMQLLTARLAPLEAAAAADVDETAAALTDVTAQRDALAEEVEAVCLRLEKTEKVLHETRLALAEAEREMAAMAVAMSAIELESVSVPDPAAAAASEALQAELAAAQRDLAATRMELAAAQTALAAAADSTELNALAAARDEAQAQLARLQAELLEATALAGQFPVLTFANEQLQAALAQSEAERATLAERLTEAVAYVRKLQGRYDFVLARLRQQLAAPAESSPDPSEEEAGKAGRPAGAAPGKEQMAQFNQIHGIGPTYERRLHQAGIHTFADLAALTPVRLAEITKARSFQEDLLSDWLAAAAKLANSQGPD